MDARTGLPVVGMVGGGQLARMTHQAAIALGQSLKVLASAPDDGAALVAPDTQIGEHTDLDALRRFAEGCDVVTFDHEHVPTEHVRALVAEGVTVYPGADALVCAQDKQLMRERLSTLGVPVPRWAPVDNPTDIVKFADGETVIVKTVRGGYDGRGVFVISSAEDIAALPTDGTRLIVEEKVPLVRELSVLVARSPFGQIAVYPVVETVQRDGICVEVLAPAPDLPESRVLEAQQIAIRIADALGVVGVMAVELFETVDGLVVNELAMRPHNSGHWTIEGARTSQFEQHIRAILDYPMGDTSLAAPRVVMANVLGGPEGGMALDERLHHLFAEDPSVKVHLYGKRSRPGRKIGHVTVMGDSMDDIRVRARRASWWLREGSMTE